MSDKDLIETLRVCKGKPLHQQGITRELLHEAAGEIERLRAAAPQVAEPRRFCRDCRYIERADFSDEYKQLEYAKCAHPSRVELVAGHGTHDCSTERGPGKCGEAGANWEERQCSGFIVTVQRADTAARRWWRLWT